MLIESMNFTIPATILLTLDDVVEGGDLVDGQAGPGQDEDRDQGLGEECRITLGDW